MGFPDKLLVGACVLAHQEGRCYGRCMLCHAHGTALYVVRGSVRSGSCLSFFVVSVVFGTNFGTVR